MVSVLKYENNKQIMRTLVTSAPLGTVGLSIALALGSSSLAQSISDPASLPKDSFHWNQEEIELGFLHYDEVFKGREVPSGEKVHELPQGLPIAAFNAGGEKGREFEDFLTEQKVAGLLILQDGVIRLERYALGFSKAGRWTSQSIAKSVTSTLAGAAIKDGYINSVDDYVTDYIPDLKGSAYEKVTIHHLLTMTTGVRWNETHTDPNSDLVRFFAEPIEPGMDETVSYMRRLTAEAEPGKKWVYKTGETHLLGVLISSATGQTLSAYLSSKIWVPYGMEQKATWILGRTDQELAGCCLQMKLRDLARFGQFVLEGGRINGESVVPDDWFQTATHTQIQLWGGWGYGYQWWTFDDGTFQALGIHGQMIHIDPARRLVVAINSAWPEAQSAKRRVAVANFLKTIAKEIDEEGTESPNP
jgi:CubicO group peptidase (beta-lactamase class C family)